MPETITVQSGKTGRSYQIELENPYSPADDQMIDAEIARLESGMTEGARIKDVGRYEQPARDIARAARSAGFTGKALREAIAIALAESGGNPRAANRTAPDDSHGLWQVNYFDKLRGERTRKFGPPEAQYNPDVNARAAYQISGGGKNFKPWTTYTSGKHRQYMDLAEVVAAEFDAPKPNPATAGAAAGIGKTPVLTQKEFIDKQKRKGMASEALQGAMTAAQMLGGTHIGAQPIEPAAQPRQPGTLPEIAEVLPEWQRQTNIIKGLSGVGQLRVNERPEPTNAQVRGATPDELDRNSFQKQGAHEDIYRDSFAETDSGQIVSFLRRWMKSKTASADEDLQALGALRQLEQRGRVPGISDFELYAMHTAVEGRKSLLQNSQGMASEPGSLASHVGGALAAVNLANNLLALGTGGTKDLIVDPIAAVGKKVISKAMAADLGKFNQALSKLDLTPAQRKQFAGDFVRGGPARDAVQKPHPVVNIPPPGGEIAPKPASAKGAKKTTRGASGLGLSPESIQQIIERGKDTARGVYSAAKEHAERTAKHVREGDVKEVAADIGDAAAGMLGNFYNKMSRFGDQGHAVANAQIKQHLESNAIHASLSNKMREGLRSVYGNWRISGIGREEVRGIAKKLRTQSNALAILNDAASSKQGKSAAARRLRESQLTDSQKKAWAPIAEISKTLVDEAGAAGVQVPRMPATSPIANLVGQRATVYIDGFAKTGVIESAQRGLVEIRIPGKRATHKVKDFDVFWTKQLTDPETYIPDVLTEEMYKKIKRRGSAVREEAVDYLVNTEQAPDAEMADAMLDNWLSSDIVAPTGGPTRLERPRVGLRLPERFYETDLEKIWEHHIKESAKRISIARHFGAQGEALPGMLKGLSKGEQESVTKALENALGTASTDTLMRKSGKLRSATSAVTTARLLSDATTAIVQLTQQASAATVLGERSMAKAAIRLSNPKELQRVLQYIKDRGLLEQDLLTLYGTDESRGLLGWVARASITGVRVLDRALRVFNLAASEILVRDILKKKALSDFDIDYLKRWAGYSDQDIAQMRLTGEMTDTQRMMAGRAGVKTQVLTSDADLPPILTSEFGRWFFRLKSYSVGQMQNVGWVANRAAKGDIVPLVRMMVYAPAAGHGVNLLQSLWENMAYGDGRGLRDIERRWGELKDAVKSGDVGQIASESLAFWSADLLSSGALGAYEWGVKPLDSANRYYGSPSAAKGLYERIFVPPDVDLAISTIVGLASAYDNEESYLEALKKVGVKKTTILRKLYRDVKGSPSLLSRAKARIIRDTLKDVDKPESASGTLVRERERIISDAIR